MRSDHGACLVIGGTGPRQGLQVLVACDVQGGRHAGCVRVELDSGVTNQAAHRFCYRRRMEAIALHFAKPLAGP